MLLSVVMAARDAAATVADAVASVLDTRASVEVIVVDDGSTDATAAVVEGLAAGDERIRVLSGAGEGPGAARNRGLAVAAGAWVTFLDADDRVEPGYLDAVAAFLAAHGDQVDLLAARTVREVAGEVVDNHPLRFRFAHGARVVDLADEPHVIQTSAATAFFRRSVIEQASLRFDEVARASEDADVVVAFLRAARPRLGLVPEATYVYRQAGETSLSRGAWSDPAKYRVPFDRLYLRWCASGDVPRWLENMLLYELSTYLDADRAVFHPSRAVDAEVRAGCAQRVRAVLECVSPEAIREYAVTPLGLDRRMMMLAAAGRGEVPAGVVRYQRRSGDPLRKHTWFFTGELPSEEYTLGGEPVAPVDAKVVAHRWFDATFVLERIVWLPDGEVEARLGGVPVPVAAYAGAPRRPDPPGRGDAVAAPAPPAPAQPAPAAPAAGPGRALALARRVRGVVARWRGGRVRPPRAAPVWVYLDRSGHAGDSAEALYRHARRVGVPGEHWFVLDADAADAARLTRDGFRLVDPGSEQFVDVWRAATDLLLSDVSDAAVGRALGAAGIRNDQRLVFLQHGILTKQLWRWLNPRRIDLMLTTTEAEHAGVVADGTSYTLTTHEVRRTGLPRHDALVAAVSAVPEEDRVVCLLAPTWDAALRDALARPGADVSAAVDASPWGRWVDLMAAPAFGDVLARRGWRPVFFLHPALLAAAPVLDARGVPWVSGADVPDALARARVVVTDRSSIVDEGAVIGVPGVLVGPSSPDPDGFVAFHAADGAARLGSLDALAPWLEGDVPPVGVPAAAAGASARVWSLLRVRHG